MAARKKSTTKKAVKTATKKTTKKVTKKAATKKEATKKEATKKEATKKEATSASLKIATVTPSRDGAVWTLAMSNGGKVKVPAAAAQSVGVRVGGPWSAKVADKVEQAAFEQVLFTRAMELLAKKGRTTTESLLKILGGDAKAKRAVAELKKHGWIG